LCDPDKPRLFHSGTFNGNPVTTAAGLVSLQHLTAAQIDTMAARAAELETVLAKAAAGVPLSVRRSGSMLQLFISEVAPDAIPERTDGAAMTAFHLAALNHGVFLAPRGLLALSTVLDDELVGEAGDRLTAALADLAEGGIPQS
jgi:glutamate-1-semialdehyde 2,1-aminomutase